MNFQIEVNHKPRGLFEDITNTPHKKFKHNEDSTFDHSKPKQKDGSMGRKDEKREQSIRISQFDLPLQHRNSSQSQKMDQELPAHDSSEGSHLMLARKMTCMIREEYEDEIGILNLYRSNSNIDQRRNVQDLKLGDNIYLRQLNSPQLPAPSSRTSMENQIGSRIDQDYQIQTNIYAHKKRHENYICLNKLERVFYYVKKIMFSHNGKDEFQTIQHLTSEQVKIYHKDREGCFLKFYQSWLEHNALYLTFQVAVESLEDCIKMHKKLKEAQAWDLIRDCSKSLNWLAVNHNSSHMNIKPGNILRCQKKFKFSDPFLDSSILQVHLKDQGEHWDGWNYLSPQIKQFYSLIQGLDLVQSDIYSLGMCIIQNLLGEKYFPREGKAFRLYVQKHIHGYSPSFMKTLMRMISHDPTKRPTPEQLCEMGRNNDESDRNARKRRFSI